MELLREPFEQPLGDRDRERLVRLLEQERELVAAEPGEGVARADRRGEAPRDLLEQLVAGVVAERVVHLLEAVEVDEQHGERLAGARRAGQRLVEPVAEERTVGEAREPVVEGLVRELVLEPDALGDVAGVQDDPADVPVAAQVADVGFELAPLAELVLQAEHELVRLAVGAGCVERLAVVGVDEARESRVRARRDSRQSEHLGHRPAHVAAAARARTPRRGRSTT